MDYLCRILITVALGSTRPLPGPDATNCLILLTRMLAGNPEGTGTGMQM
jgi:hypothetical protein